MREGGIGELKVEISSKPASFYKTKRTWTRVVSMASPFLVCNTQTILAVVSWFWVIAESSSLSCSISARCTTRTPRIPWTPHTIHCQRKIAFIQNLELERFIQILMSSSGNSFIQEWRQKGRILIKLTWAWNLFIAGLNFAGFPLAFLPTIPWSWWVAFTTSGVFSLFACLTAGTPFTPLTPVTIH